MHCIQIITISFLQPFVEAYAHHYAIPLQMVDIRGVQHLVDEMAKASASQLHRTVPHFTANLPSKFGER